MTTRYHFEDFCWFPCASVENAVNTLKWRTDAIHINCGISSGAELQKLLDACLEANCVEGLFLERNGITSDVMGVLTEALRVNKRLKTLMLGDNAICDKGVDEFCNFVKQPDCSLKEFSIGKEFGNHGALLIAKALNFNKDIEAIYINNNKMDNIGSDVLAEVVSRHATCSNVQVSSEKIASGEFEAKLNSMTQVELKKAFEMAVVNNEKGPWMRSKIMVVGQGRAGKTASVRSLLGQKYVPGLDSTIGASISQSNTRAGADGAAWGDNTDAKVDFTVDTAARLAALKLARQRNEDKEKLEKFDINQTIEYYQKRQNDIKNLETKETKKIINQVMSEEEINQRFDTQLVTIKHSGKDDIAFTIWDYGGQTVFYTLHHLFLTRYGIYLLVFDMREIVCRGMTAVEKAQKRALTREYLLFWLNSVTMHAPDAPLMIIGTFMDALQDEEEFRLVNRILDRILSERHKKQVHYNGALIFFPLNNRRPETDCTDLFAALNANMGRNIEVIRDQIEVIARDQEFVNQELSLRWVKTLDTMLEQPENFLDLKRVYEIAEQVGISSMQEVDKMLAFFHELGMIVHLTSTLNLRQVVTIKPQWLIDALSQIIRDEKLHKFDMKAVKKAGLKGQYDMLMAKHVASIDWMEYVWKKKKVDFLVDLMRRTLLISDWKFGEFENDTGFLVPSLINRYNTEHADIAEVMLLQFDSPKEDQLLTPEEIAEVKLQRNLITAQGLKKKIPGFGRLNMKKVIPNLFHDSKEELPKYEKERDELLGNSEVNKFFVGEMPINFLMKLMPSPELEEDMNKSKRKRQQKKGKEKGKVKELTEEDRLFHLGRLPGRPKKEYGYAAPEGVIGIVFDFTESFLPNGVFQRLLCLCILKSTNSKRSGKVPEPELFSNSAIIWLTHDHKLTMIMHNSQILCLVEKEHLQSYKMLNSMMEKLKADVMGTSLKWKVFLEIELTDPQYYLRLPKAWRVDPEDMLVKDSDKNKPQKLSLHSFKPVSFVKEKSIEPWYHKKQQEKQTKDITGLELEAFIQDLDQFF